MTAHSVLSFAFLLLICASVVVAKCGTHDAMDAALARDEVLKNKFLGEHQRIMEIANTHKHLATRSEEALRVPVVFHVLKGFDEEYPIIEDSHVEQEMTWLNEWYRATNTHYDTTSTFWDNERAVASDMAISFELASYDPNGQATTGILYYDTPSAVADSCDFYNFDDSAGKSDPYFIFIYNFYLIFQWIPRWCYALGH